MLDVGGSEPMRLLAERVVNSAGLEAPALAARFIGRDHWRLPKTYYCKGNYYGLATHSPFSHLIYPVPERAGLGVHVTVDLAGRCRFGPDTEWIDAIHYPVDPKRADAFYAEVRKYWPGLPDGALVPDYAGIRPKLAPAGAPVPTSSVRPGRARRGGPGRAVRHREPRAHRLLADRLRGGAGWAGRLADEPA